MLLSLRAVINAAAALWVAGAAPDWKSAATQALAAIDSGAVEKAVAGASRLRRRKSLALPVLSVVALCTAYVELTQQ